LKSLTVELFFHECLLIFWCSEVLEELVHRYLELRGVMMMTASFLHQLLSNKNVFVSIFWLDMLKSFVQQST
jgi:hypothetical protein